MDPPPWSDGAMKLTVPNVHSFQLPDPSWSWVSPRWLIDMTTDVDEDGWQYATRFAARSRWRGRHSAAKSFVRRRRWVRLRRRVRMSNPTIPPPAHIAAAGSGGSEWASSSAVFNPNLQPPRKLPRAKKISGDDVLAAVGAKASSSRKPTKQVEYTLKDGKYRAHSSAKLEKLRIGAISADRRESEMSRTSMELPASPDGLEELDRRLMEQQRMMAARAMVDGCGIAGTDTLDAGLDRAASPLSDIAATTGGSSVVVTAVRSQPVSTWFDAAATRFADHQSAMAVSTRYTRDLPLPTGGVAGGESDGDTGYVDGIQKRFPKLTGLMPPEPTMPLDPVLRGLHYGAISADGSGGAVVSQQQQQILRRKKTLSLIPRASNVLSRSRRPSIATVVVVPTVPPPVPLLPAAAELVPVSVPVARNNTAVSNVDDIYGGGGLGEVPPVVPLTVSIATDDSGFSEAAMRHRPSMDSMASEGDGAQSPGGASIVSIAAYQRAASGPEHLAQYADPYAALQLGGGGGGGKVAGGDFDDGLLEMTVESLKQTVLPISLDRERLEILREALLQGGVTAAAVWKSLPWVHYELLQYDSARHRLIAMMMRYADTCPMEALTFWEVGSGVTDRERDEYRGLAESIGKGGGAGMTASQVWRFVIRPVVAEDGDLFYSDFKNMVVAVAKWSLRRGATQKQEKQK
ncbi:hypothetical protein FBU59_001280 [Linderina macrospora]|uniref:Uncharacterized protein n=1 Tax=Linderina macrospora TaxID=4868 RepID=A0ACC1JEH2_9FUNG|nr:hypothetical protein FBU59_001280 [Linderina macrospora]